MIKSVYQPDDRSTRIWWDRVSNNRLHSKTESQNAKAALFFNMPQPYLSKCTIFFIRRRSYIENSFIQEIHYVYNIVFEPEIHTKPFKNFHYIVYKQHQEVAQY